MANYWPQAYAIATGDKTALRALNKRSTEVDTMNVIAL